VSELGELLRKARLEHKISLDDLQEATKIRKRYLEAIEEGNYKVLPGSFYVRAFIKSYAEMVGLDPNELLKLYQNQIPASEAEPVAQPIKRVRASSRNSDRISRWVSSIVMVSFVLLILGALYFYFYNSAKSPSAVDNGSPNQNNRITDSTPPVPAQMIGGGTTTSSSVYGKQPESVETVQVTPTPTPPPKQTVSFVKTDADKNIDYYTVTGSKLELQLKVVSGDCWYSFQSVVDGKNKVIKSEQKSAGYTNSWSLDTSAYLRVGKWDAVEITVNGTTLSASDNPNPKNFEFDLQPS
jgi:cytoskeletal protein RodZ